MELFNRVLKYILKSKTRPLDLRVCRLFAPSHFAAGFCAQNAVDYRSNLCREQNYLLFKLLRVIYIA